MKNFVQPGDVLTMTATAAVGSGDGVQIGSVFGVALTDAAIGEDVALSVVGVFELPKTAADDIAVGEKVYWDAGTAEVTDSDAAGDLIGVAVAVAAAGATTATVRLNGAFL